MDWFERTVEQQREALALYLEIPMARLARQCATAWSDPSTLDRVLHDGLPEMPLCQVLYAIDTTGMQVSSNITLGSADTAKRGQNLSTRPFLVSAIPYQGFLLSEVYISQLNDRSCITAVQAVAGDSVMLGFVAADFYLSDLPLLQQAEKEFSGWRQIKGDPVIRSALFQQQRARSQMDERIDDVIAIMDELMCERGIFHGKLHFSSSRATLWLTDDPYRYRLHVLDEIIDPSVCLTYPNRPYPAQATVGSEQVRTIFERFKVLREADENIYLRAGSLNVINGMVGLTFSCDGSHYMPAEAFLKKGDAFWFGVPDASESTTEPQASAP